MSLPTVVPQSSHPSLDMVLFSSTSTFTTVYAATILLPLLPSLILHTTRIYPLLCADYIRSHYCSLEILLLYQNLGDIVKFTYVCMQKYSVNLSFPKVLRTFRPLRDCPSESISRKNHAKICLSHMSYLSV